MMVCALTPHTLPYNSLEEVAFFPINPTLFRPNIRHANIYLTQCVSHISFNIGAYPFQGVWPKIWPFVAFAASQSQLVGASHWIVFPIINPTVSPDSTLLNDPSSV